MGMVMNLDKCIGCHTCSVTCKNVWTNRRGTEYVWFNNVETKPGRAIRVTMKTKSAGRGLEARSTRPAAAEVRWQAEEAAEHLLESRPPDDRRVLQALDL